MYSKDFLLTFSSIFRAESLASEIKAQQGELADYNAVRSNLCKMQYKTLGNIKYTSKRNNDNLQ